ncbi:RHS repeat-associated core domain-containing protein [Enterobacter ludwigii]|uniref:RHS repeat-associated core domain-containing protein n=1 Tax=Enterobacter ludwigii TaxID=299767 RepID=UPI002B4BB7DC|nr:RHS repeat-associated core domain-containing protein [Enterobacter ludwigii]WRM04084.1 RHS repeat-associated core domain-containing protein [Enterobacter ludwigii]
MNMTPNTSLTEAPLHAGTPSVTVTGSSGTPVRTLAFLRHPDEAGAGTPARILVSRTVTDVPARTRHLYGARSLAGGIPDATTVTGLAGQALSLHTADGDTTLTFPDTAGRPLWTRNAQGTVSTLTYEAPGTAGRPLSVSETVTTDGAAVTRVRETFTYAPVEADHQARNLAGALVMHHDNAGFSEVHCVSLTGQPLQTQQHLLPPEAGLPDWGAATPPATDAPLTVSGTYDATGAPLTQTNAAGVTTLTAYDLSGAVREVRVRYTHGTAASGRETAEVITLKDILYRADGVVLSQTGGNGVTDTYEYDPRTQLLTRHTVQRPAGHPLGALLISDLHYTYDPAGNILTLNEAATQTQWHRNQVTDGRRTYAYDTLYRLVSATGRERLADTARGPQTRLQAYGTGAGGEWFGYTERYTYDDGDNLIQTGHAGNRPWTRAYAVSATSNRALQQPEGGTVSPDEGFLPGGLQKQLADGRTLEWYADGQLREVRPVTRAGAEADDTETYRYSDGGTRVRKYRTTKISGGTHIHTTTYAGGAETRQRRLAGSLQLDIVITQAGGMRLTEDRLTGGIHLRHAFTDHLGSSGGETDAEGNITSREEYYPYGGSAGADEEAAEMHDRTQRYSGKERDATGLYYYGWRYYRPEAGRWLSADPGGLADGVNLYRFCRNNPVNIIDNDGLAPVYHYIEPRAARTEFEAGSARPFYKMSIDFKEPKQYTMSDMAKFYLEKSQKGNIFTGIVNIESGKIYMYPTSLVREGGGDTFSWQTEYQGKHHDKGENIIHHPRQNPSHRQLVDKVNKEEKTKIDHNKFIGFTFYDLKDVRGDVAGNFASHQKEMSVIYGRSRSLNAPHMTKLNDDGTPEMTVGDNEVVHSAELPIEIKRGILGAFQSVAKGDMKSLLEQEYNSPDFNVEHFDVISKKYNIFQRDISDRKTNPLRGTNGRMYI